MHPDVHLRLHAIRAAGLRREAAGHPAPGAGHSSRAGLRARIRTRLGWTLVELGLRLVHRRAVSRARPA
ncbi:hypothetical protein ABZ707_17170 [Streptomyces sp. NPDC006923]|uniref:hypothetical protein n=1 Tax=Streptomyces sp. NPDC006923 TaxID=3155355 RepID=UPI0033CA493E